MRRKAIRIPFCFGFTNKIPLQIKTTIPQLIDLNNLKNNFYGIYETNKLELFSKNPINIPKSKIIKFFNLKRIPNFFSQESGMSFLFSSTLKPDFDVYFAYQNKNKIIRVKIRSEIRSTSIIVVFLFNLSKKIILGKQAPL